jgi:hypothetical protein
MVGKESCIERMLKYFPFKEKNYSNYTATDIGLMIRSVRIVVRYSLLSRSDQLTSLGWKDSVLSRDPISLGVSHHTQLSEHYVTRGDPG